MFTYKQNIDETYMAVSYQGNDASVSLPSMHLGKPVTVIGDSLFKGHKEITSIELPETLKSIGSFAFDGLTGLAQINLPDGLEDIMQYAFARCGITSIRIPSSVRFLPPYAFLACKSLSCVRIENPSIRLYRNVFTGCESLKEATAGENTIALGE